MSRAARNSRASEPGLDASMHLGMLIGTSAICPQFLRQEVKISFSVASAQVSTLISVWKSRNTLARENWELPC